MSQPGDRTSTAARVDGALSADELAAEQVADLPKREAMSLLDPNMLGGVMGTSDPAGMTGTGSTGGTGSTDPTGTTTGGTGAAGTATDTATGASSLAGHLAPDASSLPSGTYSPTATSSAQ